MNEETTIKEELKEAVKDTIALIMENRNNWDKLLNDYALDCEVEKFINGNELIGFSLLLSYGGPSIEWILHRGVSYVVGSWGNTEVKEYIDHEIANEFLDYLNETVKF